MIKLNLDVLVVYFDQLMKINNISCINVIATLSTLKNPNILSGAFVVDIYKEIYDDNIRLTLVKEEGDERQGYAKSFSVRYTQQIEAYVKDDLFTIREIYIGNFFISLEFTINDPCIPDQRMSVEKQFETRLKYQSAFGM